MLEELDKESCGTSEKKGRGSGRGSIGRKYKSDRQDTFNLCSRGRNSFMLGLTASGQMKAKGCKM